MKFSNKMNNIKKIISLLLIITVLFACNKKDPQSDKEKDFIDRWATLKEVEIRGYRYRDKTGKIVVKPQFTYAGDFTDGLARVRIGNKKTGTFGYIDKTGKFVINPLFDKANDFAD